MILQCTPALEHDVYEYWVTKRKQVPYYFEVSFEDWKQSMFHDRDYDGQLLFDELKTMVLMDDKHIRGLIQFGRTNFILDQFGKNMREHYGVIRTLLYDEDTCKADIVALLRLAATYFANHEITRPYAYFHYFGMSCYARVGKLHESEYHMEEALLLAGYTKEHQNIYYSKRLDDACRLEKPDQEMELVTDNTLQSSIGKSISISIRVGKHEVGACEIYIPPNSTISYLRWIFINKKYANQGYGTRCMKLLLHMLTTKGFSRLDTDTADNNIVAQRYYQKHGFRNLGTMRSYMTNARKG